MSERVRIGVIGTGYLGRLHARVLSEMPDVELVGFVEPDDAAAAEVEAKIPVRRFGSVSEIASHVSAAVVATNTAAHAIVASELLSNGVDVMIEKPITATVAEARALLALAAENGRIIQVGHVERYNPAIAAAIPHMGEPRYIEADRIGVFSGRSLDIDVLLDLMIHDLQLVLSLAGSPVAAIHAVGVPVLTSRVDMANVRLEMENGAVANLTASRVSNERVRKFRLFGSDSYLSVDTKEQAVHGYRLRRSPAGAQIEPLDLTVEKKEPLRAELEAFIGCVLRRERPLVGAEEGLAALDLALRVGGEIDRSLARWHSGGSPQ